MALRTAGSVLVVFLWSVAVVLGQDGWSVFYTTQSICALKGSSVDLTCSFSYPRGHKVTSSFWFTKMETGVEPKDLGQDPENAGRLEYHGDKKKDCTLRITDLRERDSATYKFRFTTDQTRGRYYGHPGVTLSVTALQVKVTPINRSERRTLTCRTTSCPLTGNPTYTWYKNGQIVTEKTSTYSVHSNAEDSYSCAVKGHEDLHSPAVCVQGQSCKRVTYNKMRICVLKGSTVDISCTYVGYYYTTSTFWFRSDKSTPEDLTRDPGYAGRVKYPGTYEGPFTLRITDLREEDSAEYRFTFKTNNFEWGHSFPGTTLSVTGFQVKVTPEQYSEYKTLTCSTACILTGNPTYIWYKNGQIVTDNTSPYSVYSNAADSYSCTVKGHEDLHSPAVCVQGQSCSRVTYTKRGICVLKGSTVDISCTYVGYYATTSTFWFRSDKLTPEDLTTDPGYAGRVKYTGTYRGPFTLRITDLREEDSAEYRFTFKTHNFEWGHSFPGITLSVTGLQVKVTPAAKGQRTLTCSTTCTLTDNHNPTYIWYKNGQRLHEPASQQHSSNLLVVWDSSVNIYSCAVEGQEDLHSPVVCFQVKVTPEQNSEYKTLTCSTTCILTGNPTYIWYKNGQVVTEKMSLYAVLPKAVESYYCAVKGHEDLHSPAVYGPKSTSVSVSPSGEIVEGSSVTLTCSSDANPPVDRYTWWYKNGGEFQSMTGPQHVFNQIQSSDTGEYYCEAQNEMGTDRSRTINMDVKYDPKNTSVSVSPSGEIVEGSSVTLTCSSDANPPVDKYTWYFQNKTFLNGFEQIYNISNFKSKDNGHYHCEAWNGRGSRNSTALMIILPGKQTVLTAAVGITVVVLVVILCLSGLMWFRKKASKSTSDTRDTSENVQGDSSPVYDNISGMVMTSTAAQTAATVDQDDVHYASVHFSRSKIQEVPLYSTVQLPQPQKQDEDVQYDAVKFNWPSNSNRPTAAQAAGDSSAIYSRVNKPRRAEHNKPRTKRT